MGSAVNAIRKRVFGKTKDVPLLDAAATYEAVPSIEGGHIQDMATRPQAERSAFTYGNQGWQAPDGSDVLHNAAGLPPGPTHQTRGLFEGQQNPSHAAQTQVRTGPGGINPQDEAAMNMAASARGYIDFQDGSAWNAFNPLANAPNSMPAVNIGYQGPMTEQQMATLGALHPHIADRGAGATGMFFEPSDGTPATKGPVLQQAAGVPVTEGSQHGGYIDYAKDWRSEPGSGRATSHLIDDYDAAKAINPEAATGVASTPEAGRVAGERLMQAAQAASEGTPVREDYLTAMRIIQVAGEQGVNWVEALRAAVDRGIILPAAFATATGAALHQQGSDTTSSTGLL